MSQTEVRTLLETLQSRMLNSPKTTETSGQSQSSSVLQEAMLPSMTRLKELTRDAQIAQPLYSLEGLDCLLYYGFPDALEYDTTALEAQRCLANALLQSDKCVDLVMTNADRDFARILRKTLQIKGTVASDFLLGRILFLLATKSGTAFIEHARQASLQDLRQVLNILQLQYVRQCSVEDASQMPVTIELLKLLYSLTVFARDMVQELTGLTRDVLALLTQSAAQSAAQAQTSLVQHTVSLLTNLHIAPEDLEPFFPKAPSLLLVRLEATLEALQEGMVGEGSLNADEQAAPLLTLISKIAASGHAETRNLLRDRLLVQDNERHLPLGRGLSLASRLLNTTTTSGSLCARECISALLYELSDSDPKRFVHNVGYGYASGFLTAHGLPTPRLKHGETNPVTGQNIVDEEASFASLQEMTEEEKEREAERLFVLFDRLKKTGIVDVKDPIREALESGRFEEM